MAITIQHTDDIGFTKNPFVLSITAYADDLSEQNGVKVLSADIIVDSATVDTIDIFFLEDGEHYAASLDLSQYARYYAVPADGWESSSHAYFSTVQPVRISILGQTFTFLKGGMSRHALRIASLKGTSAVSDRLTDNVRNFVASTRTSNNTLTFYRSELRDLYLGIVNGAEPKRISVSRDNDTQIVSQFLPDAHSILGFQLSKCVSNENIKKLYIERDSKKSVEVSILDDPSSEQMYLFRFLNSYGFYDNVLLYGNASDSFTNDASSEYSEYDAEIGDYVEKKSISSEGCTMTVNTGYLTPWRLNIIRDMLMSDDVCIYDAKGLIKCAVSASDISVQHVSTTPEAFTVTVVLDNEVNPDKGYDDEEDEPEDSTLPLNERFFVNSTYWQAGNGQWTGGAGSGPLYIEATKVEVPGITTRMGTYVYCLKTTGVNLTEEEYNCFIDVSRKPIQGVKIYDLDGTEIREYHAEFRVKVTSVNGIIFWPLFQGDEIRPADSLQRLTVTFTNSKIS